MLIKEEVLRRFLNKYNLDTGCCSSCHEDTSYGFDLCELDFTKKRCAFVCCRVANAWDKLLEQQPQYLQLMERE